MGGGHELPSKHPQVPHGPATSQTAGPLSVEQSVVVSHPVHSRTVPGAVRHSPFWQVSRLAHSQSREQGACSPVDRFALPRQTPDGVPAKPSGASHAARSSHTTGPDAGLQSEVDRHAPPRGENAVTGEQ